MYKKPIVLVIVLSLAMLAFAAAAVAEQDDTPDYKATFTIGEASYIVNDETSAMDVAAFVEDGRTYVPFRYLGYALGVAEQGVTWDADTKTATLTMGDTTEKFTVGSINYYVNEAVKTMDVAPLIRDNRIFLPARYVAQDFGYLVGWDEQEKVVTVTKDVPEQQSDETPPVNNETDNNQNTNDDDDVINVTFSKPGFLFVAKVTTENFAEAVEYALYDSKGNQVSDRTKIGEQAALAPVLNDGDAIQVKIYDNNSKVIKQLSSKISL